MQPMRFKKTLFGFSKEQVIDYIAQMDRLAQQQRQELVRDYEARLSQAGRELELARQQSEQHLTEARRLSERADSLQQQVASLSQQVADSQLLRQRLEETAAEREELISKYAALEKEMDRVSREALERERKLSEFIDRVQEKNVELLQKQVAMEIRVTNAEREMYVGNAPAGGQDTRPAALPSDQAAKEEIIAALDAILSKLDSIGAPAKEAQPEGRLYRLADPS